MNDNKLHGASFKHVTSIRQTETNICVGTMPDRPPRQSSYLEFVDDEVIKMTEAGRDNLDQTFGREGPQFKICLYTNGPGRPKNRYPAIRAVLPWRIHLVVQPRKTKVKHACTSIRKVEMVRS